LTGFDPPSPERLRHGEPDMAILPQKNNPKLFRKMAVFPKYFRNIFDYPKFFDIR